VAPTHVIKSRGQYLEWLGQSGDEIVGEAVVLGSPLLERR